MKNKALDLSSYSFIAGEQILIDACIWLYLFPAPSAPGKKSFIYSNAFARLLNAHAQPFLDILILSEYINRYCRIEHTAYCGAWASKSKGTPLSYKEWRKSPDFSPVASGAEHFAGNILRFCAFHAIQSCNLNIQYALQGFRTGGMDFNDAIFVDICKKQNFKFMTNDADFQEGGIEILTANPTLLRACP